MSPTLTSAGPTLQSSLPATFVERGVAVPFTTPKLGSARVRHSQRDTFELIAPNPSGGRGLYIVPWGSLRSRYALTVFDSLLMARFGELETIGPAAIRQVVLEVARDGMAGRGAADAAKAALIADAKCRAATNLALLRRLVEEADATNGPDERNQAGELQRRVQRAVTNLSGRLRLDSAAIMAGLEALARHFTPIGLGDRAAAASLPAMMSSLAQLREDLAAIQFSDGLGRAAAPLASLIDATLAQARSTLADARGQAANLVELLTAWRADPAAIQAALARTEWLLDGWDRVCRVWFAKPTLGERAGTLQEALLLTPVMPQEAAGWLGPASIDHPMLAIRTKVEHEDWRTGVGLLDVIAHNEALLSVA